MKNNSRKNWCYQLCFFSYMAKAIAMIKRLLYFTLLFSGLSASGQTFHRDSTAGGYQYSNATITDSLNLIYNLPVKVGVKVSDQMDSVHGAQFSYTIYTVSFARSVVLSSGIVPISGETYGGWNANDDVQTYNIVKYGLQTQGIYLVWQ